MKDEKGNNEAKRPGTPSESVLRQKVVPYADEIINKLLEHMRSRNPNVSLGAANTLLKKIIPDLKSIEIGGEIGEDGKRKPATIYLYASGGFIPANITLPASSSTSAGNTTPLQSPTVQGTDLASESKENLHSNNGDTKAGTS